MNEYILELAALYANRYRDRCAALGERVDNTLLRKHITIRFGAVYAAILVH